MPILNIRTNSVDVNTPGAAESHLTNNGSSWLWAVFSIFALVDLIFVAWSFTLRRNRLFHNLAIMILSISTVSYFAQASNLGFAPAPTEFGHHTPVGTLRQIWFVRYVDWILSGPLLLLTLTGITGHYLSDILTTLFMFDVFWGGLLLGAIVPSSYKWGFYVFALAGLFYTWGSLLGPTRNAAGRLDGPYGSYFIRGAGWLSFLFILYPIAWGLAEGGNVISVTSEMVFYGILDLLAKPFFLLFHLFSIRNLDTSHTLYAGYGGHGHHAGGDIDHHTAAGTHDPEKARRDSKTYKFFPRRGKHDEHHHTATGTGTGVAATAPAANTDSNVGGYSTRAHADPGYTQTAPGTAPGATAPATHLAAPGAKTAGPEGQPRLSGQTFVDENRLT